MEQLTLRFPGAISFSLLIALILSIVHLPDSWQTWRPEWVALAVIHWGILFPKESSYIHAFIAGLLLDALWGSSLGQHALGFVIIHFIAVRMGERIMPKTFSQHFFLVFICVGTYMLVNLWILGITKDKPSDWSYWFPLLSSLLAWPLVHAILNHLHIANKSL